MLKYKVIDSNTGEDITYLHDWVLSPNGELNYLYFSDLIGYPSARLVIVSIDFANDIP